MNNKAIFNMDLFVEKVDPNSTNQMGSVLRDESVIGSIHSWDLLHECDCNCDRQSRMGCAPIFVIVIPVHSTK